MHSTVSPRRIAATLSVAALLFAGAACSAEGDDASPDTTAAGDVSTTDGGGDATTTTESTDPVDPSDLEALLPSDDDIPSEYVRQPDDSSDDSSDSELDAELEKACPDAVRIGDLIDDGSDDSDQVSRSWKTEDDDREIEVQLKPANEKDVPVEDFIDAINSCDVIETDLNGTAATLELAAESLDLGDEAMKLEMTITFEILGEPTELVLHGFMFHRDGVAAQVSATSGLAQTGATDFEVVDADVDVAEQLAADLDDAIQSR